MMPVRRSMQMNRKVRTDYTAIEENHKILEEKAINCVINKLPETVDEKIIRVILN